MSLSLLVLVGAALLVLKQKSTIKTTATPKDKQYFIEKITPYAISIKEAYGIGPKITMAQAALESRWGVSQLTRAGNNLFGKIAKPGESSINLPTAEYIKGKKITVVRPFRNYLSWNHSIKDWADLISKAKRYKKAYKWAKKGSIWWYSGAIKKAGYATDPKYPKMLRSVHKEVKRLSS